MSYCCNNNYVIGSRHAKICVETFVVVFCKTPIKLLKKFFGNTASVENYQITWSVSNKINKENGLHADFSVTWLSYQLIKYCNDIVYAYVVIIYFCWITAKS